MIPQTFSEETQNIGIEEEPIVSTIDVAVNPFQMEMRGRLFDILEGKNDVRPSKNFPKEVLEKVCAGSALSARDLKVIGALSEQKKKELKDMLEQDVFSPFSPFERELLLILWWSGPSFLSAQQVRSLLDRCDEYMKTFQKNPERVEHQPQRLDAALLFYLLHLKILEMPEEKRNFYDTLIDPRIFQWQKKDEDLQAFQKDVGKQSGKSLSQQGVIASKSSRRLVAELIAEFYPRTEEGLLPDQNRWGRIQRYCHPGFLKDVFSQLKDRPGKDPNRYFDLSESFALSSPTPESEQTYGPNLSEVFLYGKNPDHQRYLNVAQLGLPSTLLRQVGDIYSYWLNKGIPSVNFQVFLQWYQEVLEKYMLGLGYEPADVPMVFPALSGTEAFSQLLSFLPPGNVVLTDREYSGNRELLELSVRGSGKNLHTVQVKNPQDIPRDISEKIQEVISSSPNKSSPVYVLVPEMSFDGTVFPIKELKQICAERGVILIVDSCQAFGAKATQLGDVNLLSYRKAAGLANPSGAVLINPRVYADISERTGNSLKTHGTIDLAGVGAAIHVMQEVLGNDEVLVFGNPLENAAHGCNSIAGIDHMEQCLGQLQKLFLLQVAKHPILREKVEYVTLSPENSPGRISLRLKGFSAQEVVDSAARKGVKCSNLSDYSDWTKDVIRFSFSPYHSDESVYYAVGSLLEFLQSHAQDEIDR